MSQAQQSLGGIAIVGMAGRFPGARNISEFWKCMLAGEESLPTPVAGYRRVDEFDASFFDISPAEAQVMDPQHRIFLEECWSALEDAACDPSSFPGSIGVFGGAGRNTYWEQNLLGNSACIDAAGEPAVSTGNENDYLTARVSYKLDLRGPAITVQTGASTSLVAVALAVQSLQTFGSDIALAGGVSVISPKPQDHETAAKHCGGAGVVALKRISDAIADGDHIYAVIKSASMNNDGGNKAAFDQPSAEGLAEVVAVAHALAGSCANSILYVETAGAGTPDGNPIELAGLTRAFQATTSANGFCAIGSLREKFGDLGAASGVAGLIKTALALHHGKIPPGTGFAPLDSETRPAESPFRPCGQATDWPAPTNSPRRAGVNAFGIGGTNAHVILEEPPSRVTAETGRPENMVILSARSESALAERAGQLADHIENNPALSLADIAYTLQIGRKHFDCRRALVCPNREVAISALRGFESRRTFGGKATRRKIAFLFPGRGAQFCGMGSQLYDCEPVFRKALDEACSVLRKHLGLDLRQLIHSTGDAGTRLHEERYAQPAVFAVSVALARFWSSVGASPSALLGHGPGEYAAAVISGILSLDDAAAIVAAQACLAPESPGGCMLAARIPESKIASIVTDGVRVIAVNSPESCLLEGENEAIANLEARLVANGVACKRLATATMGCAKGAFDWQTELPGKISLNAPGIPIVSCVTGTWLTHSDATSQDYWAARSGKTIQFSAAVSTLLLETNMAFIECGPGQATSQFLRQHETKRLCIPSLKDRIPDISTVYHGISHLWSSGCNFNWEALHAGEVRSRLALPAYPFEQRRFWAESSRSSSQKIATALAAAQETPYDGFAAATILDSKNAQKTL